jgi:hypothetical protein
VAIINYIAALKWVQTGSNQGSFIDSKGHSGFKPYFWFFSAVSSLKRDVLFRFAVVVIVKTLGN